MAPNITTTALNATAEKPKNGGGSGHAFVTFLAGNGDYVKGVVGLAKGLRKVKSEYPLVVAVLHDVPEEHRKILNSQGCIVREIEPVYPPKNQTHFAMAYYVINYSKLRIWEDFLNMFFKEKYKPIPNVYNLVLAMLWRHPENVELEKVKVVHYCAAGSKPWRYTGKEENMEREDIKMVVKKWWDIYEDETLDYEDPLSLECFKVTLKDNVGVIKFVPAPSAA
ncbi:unnamed protein product [Lupinus luteus]|uniref:Hexosyltransferase n=1 Tax=Lupinus luteus TaxID=3873 RepID=A0AAV1VZW5_LUPLU